MKKFILFLLIILMLPATAEAKRDVSRGDCGLDAAHIKNDLYRLKLIHSPKGSCINTKASFAIVAFQKREKLPRTGVITPGVRSKLKKARKPHARKGASRRIDVYINKQLVVLVKRNKVKAMYSVSTGMPGYDTPRGNYSIFRKERMSWSNPYSVWMPWSSYFVGGIAFHENPDVPTYAASHGCIRIPAGFAKRVYKFAKLGTPVKVW